MTSESIESVILGSSPAIAQVREMIARFAPTVLPVLIEGPTGAGKELVAQALHRAGGRSGEIVSVNTAAVSESLFESELFGHVKGAFSGALRDRTGYLAEAHRGTLFLDEIASLGLSLQPKLLRALETHQFRPVGARHDHTSDFRLIAAANENLHDAVAAGRFRADLLHRLGAAVIRVPSLAERIDDVPILALRFASELSSAHGPISLSDRALQALQQRPWPGNVRELRFTVHCAAALAPNGCIDRDVLNAMWTRAGQPAEGLGWFDIERRRIRALLEEHGWHVGRAASALGVHRVTLSRRMRRFGIRRPRSAARECVPGELGPMTRSRAAIAGDRVPRTPILRASEPETHLGARKSEECSPL